MACQARRRLRSPQSRSVRRAVASQSFCEREGWVLNDLSGRYVYVGDSGDVIETSTLKIVGNLPPLANTRKLIDVDWTKEGPVATSTRFGLGHVIE